MTLVVKENVPWRACACALVLAVLIGLAARPLLGEQSSRVAPATVRLTAGSAATLAGLSPQARAQIAAAIAAEQPGYAVRSGSAGLLAANPAQGLNTSFLRSGPMVSGRGVSLGLSLRAVGRGSTLRGVASAQPRAHANRVTYAHPGVSEWYANGTLGLEQGFTVTHDPLPSAGGPLTLAMSTSGGASATLAPSGESVAFDELDGRALRYGSVSASDASGRALHTWLTVEGKTLLLHVDTAHAHFPVRIDPLIEQEPEAQLEAVLEKRGTAFGRSVALSADGNTAVVGGPGGADEVGAAWVFTRSGKTWTQQGNKLAIPLAEESVCSEEVEEAGEIEPEECGLGWSVAISGDGNTVLLGAPHAMSQQGSAWIFNRTTETGTWAAGEQLSAPEGEPNGHFGRSVALSSDGNTALIGAPSGSSGRAWVFARGAGGWSVSGGALAAAEKSGDPRFGRSVALSGDGQTALVGGPGDGNFLGAAWAFSRAGSSWVPDGAKIVGGGLQPGGHFGFSVALSGDGTAALIGAYQNAGDQGGVWTYSRSGGSWTQVGEPLAGSGEEELFGYALALSPDGDAALVGAPRAQGARGAAWLYGRESASSSWNREKELVGGSEERSKAHFGASVAISADAATFAVGGPSQRFEGGAAWVFGRGPSVLDVSPRNGPATGHTVVSIKGEHLSEASAVDFGSSPALEFSLVSDKEIIAISPPGANGESVDVTVETANGLSATGPNDEFEYSKSGASKGGALPAVESVVPNEGPAAGGTTVTIGGEHLAGTTAVMFGSAAAASFTVVSDGSITAVSPKGTGVVDITIVDPLGTSLTRLADHFKYKGKGGEAEVPGGGGPENGVLGSGPTNGPLGSVALAGCGVAMLSKTLAVQPHSRAVLKLGGYGFGKCSGKVRLRVKTRLPHKRFGTKTIGTAIFTAFAGKHLAVKIHLNAAGRRLLAKGHGRLNASVLIVRSSPAPAQARTASVRLRVQKPHRAKPIVK